MKLSIVTPLYKSAPYLRELHRRTVDAVKAAGIDRCEIILVNDGSPDDSLDIAVELSGIDPNVLVVDLSRNFGQHQAVMTGLALAKGEYVFIMDSDLEDEPEWLGLFKSELAARNCDVVYGVNNDPKGGWVYTQIRGLFYKLLNLLSPNRFPPNVCSARLMSRRYVEALLQFREREIFMAGIWHVVGFRQVPIEVRKLSTSPTSYSTWRLASLFVNAITAFSTKPLIIISVLGIALSAIAAMFLAYILYQRLVLDAVLEGWTSVMAAMLILGGINLLANGIIAIYIAKVFIEVKQRPRAIVRQIYRAGTTATPTAGPGSTVGTP